MGGLGFPKEIQPLLKIALSFNRDFWYRFFDDSAFYNGWYFYNHMLRAEILSHFFIGNLAFL